MYPKIIIDKNKLIDNTIRMKHLTEANGISYLSLVVKVLAGYFPAVEAITSAGIECLADSRIENLKKFQSLPVKKALMRLPMPSQASMVVRYADWSLNSEINTVRKLNNAAKNQGKRHGIILMFDMGDLREGIFYQDDYLDIVDEILAMDHIDLIGIGTNLTCYGGVIPDHENLSNLVKIAHTIEHEFDIELPLISGGNSSTVHLFDTHQIPEGINHLRIGEALLLGRETSYGKALEGLHDDVFTLQAQLIELKEKPSYPIGKIGMNSFGEIPIIQDKGWMRRGILAIGKQDVQLDNLLPLDLGVELIGGSSDHLIVELPNDSYKVGDVLSFRPNYPGLLQLMTSSYVKKELR